MSLSLLPALPHVSMSQEMLTFPAQQTDIMSMPYGGASVLCVTALNSTTQRFLFQEFKMRQEREVVNGA